MSGALLRSRLRARAQGLAQIELARRYKDEYDRLYAEILKKLHRESGLEPPRLRSERRRG